MDVRVYGNVAARLESPCRRTACRILGELELAFDEIVELAYRGLVGVERHCAVRAVKKDDFSRLHARGDVHEPRDGRDGEGSCKKRYMARRGATVCGEAEDKLAWKLNSLGRRKVVGDDNGRRPYLDMGAGRKAGERLEDPSLNVVEIAHAFAEIRVVHALELLARAVGGLPDRGLGVQPVADHVPFSLLLERLVLENHQMALEHAHVAAASALAENGDQRLEVAFRLDDGALKAHQLVVHAVPLDEILRDGHLPVASVHEDRTGREASRGRQSRDRRHWSLTAHQECRTCVRRAPQARQGPRRPAGRRP